MKDMGLEGAVTIAANTDSQALDSILADRKIQLGRELLRGLGAGGDPDLGLKAMTESREQVKETLFGADMVFLTAGMGGGTGTGGISIASDLVRELGSLCVAVVTKPFYFEGIHRMKKAEEGLRVLRDKVNTLLVISNDRLLEKVSRDTTIEQAFSMVNEVLHQAVRTIVDIIQRPGVINVDFADVKTVMKEGTQAIMGRGTAEGENRAEKAARAAIQSPLLDGADIQGARALLVNVVTDRSMTMSDFDRTISFLREEAKIEKVDPDVYAGFVIDPTMEGRYEVNVIATGIGAKKPDVTMAFKEGNVVQEDLWVPAFRRRNKDTPAYLRTEEERTKESGGTF
jgi:cell division protein FtsZ